MTEPSHSTAPRPLDDDELDELEERLESYPDSMSPEMIDGFICSLIIGPVEVSPSEWLFAVLGEQPDTATDADTRRLIELLVRHWNHVASGLRENWSGVTADEGAEQMYFPLLAEDDNGDPDFRTAQAWAEGFRAGLEWLEEPHIAQIETDEECIAIFSLIAALDSGEKDDGTPLGDSERDELIPPLTAALQYLYAFWRRWLRDLASAKQPHHAPELPGRNDLCPCGSGKKYKKCCGSPEKLH